MTCELKFIRARISVLVLRLIFLGDERMAEAAMSQNWCLFSWGANSYGQLGLGHKDDTLLPTRCKLDGHKDDTLLPMRCKLDGQGSDGKQLVQVTGGAGHSMLLTADGQMCAFGWNKSGQLGLQPHMDITATSPSSPHPPLQLDDVTVPRSLSIEHTQVSKVACGWNHTLIVSKTGGVFTWGANTFGQLGMPQAMKQSERPLNIPQEAFSGTRVTDIAAGLRHSLAITESGGVYSWGDGRKGQLGHGREHQEQQPAPKIIEALADCQWKSVAAGAYHSAAVTVDGDLFMWGLNQHGQCAIGKLTGDSRAWSKDSDVQDQFKLGGSDWITNVYLPLAVQTKGSKFKVTQAHCGWSHSIAITVDGAAYTWGRCDYGQLGRPATSAQQADDCASQSVYSWEPMEVPGLRCVKQVACGSEHTIVVDADDCVVTFGWNEHGMCGTGDEANVTAPYTVDALRAWRPLLVGSGAGHCLVVAECRAP